MAGNLAVAGLLLMKLLNSPNRSMRMRPGLLAAVLAIGGAFVVALSSPSLIGSDVGTNTVQGRSNVFPAVLTPGGAGRHPAPPARRPDAATGQMTNLANRLSVKATGPGTFEIGMVRLDRESRTVSFPALFNQEIGGVEFLLVTPYGRTHESILRTEVEPFQIHIAMLLLDAVGNTNGASAGTPRPAGQPTQAASTDRIGGDPMTIEVRWKGPDGRERSERAEDFVANVKTGKAMSRGNWTYTGSYVHRGLFVAQLDGTIVSVIREPAALVNSLGEGTDNDDIWAVNTNTVPSMNTPAEVVFRLGIGEKKP